MGRILIIYCLIIATIIVSAASSHANGILLTKHNLSVSGTGDIKAVSENRVCIFCHTPHHSSPVTPLWSRPLSTTVYELYASSTLLAKPGQPSGASKLCLSCHDGTIALGQMYGTTEAISFAGGITTLPSNRSSNLHTDLSNDHPISFPYTRDLAFERGELNDPATLPQTLRFEAGQIMQCTTCHNPHKDPYGKFLVMSNTNSALCRSCHSVTGWDTSTHATTLSVAPEGCGNCHVPHNAGGSFRLLKLQTEEDNCFPCHKAGGNAEDMQTIFGKSYRHPVDLAIGIHDPKESSLQAAKHVECADCHNVHRIKDGTASPPDIRAINAGTSGVTSSGVPIAEASYEYEVCFKCHAENSFTGIQTIPRQVNETNSRMEFSGLNPSYHPVTETGKAISVPSLRPGYGLSSRIYCTDCHGSDSSIKAGGSGPNGPHGSIYPHILLARYEQDIYPLPYQESNYTLCFRCHDQNILFEPTQTAFPPHSAHVVNRQVPCSVCHDAHGVSSALGATATANAHLINFDTRFVTTGTYNASTRSCATSCHLTNPKSY